MPECVRLLGRVPVFAFLGGGGIVTGYSVCACVRTRYRPGFVPEKERCCQDGSKYVGTCSQVAVGMGACVGLSLCGRNCWELVSCARLESKCTGVCERERSQRASVFVSGCGLGEATRGGLLQACLCEALGLCLGLCLCSVRETPGEHVRGRETCSGALHRWPPGNVGVPGAHGDCSIRL